VENNAPPSKQAYEQLAIAERELDQVKQNLHSAYAEEGSAWYEGRLDEAVAAVRAALIGIAVARAELRGVLAQLPAPTPWRSAKKFRTPDSEVPHLLEPVASFEDTDFCYTAEARDEPPFEARVSVEGQPDLGQWGLNRWLVADGQTLLDIAEDIAAHCRTGVGKVTLVVERLRTEGLAEKADMQAYNELRETPQRWQPAGWLAKAMESGWTSGSPSWKRGWTGYEAGGLSPRRRCPETEGQD
jgi:hypothetical protein